jgi:hypothetical protein
LDICIDSIKATLPIRKNPITLAASLWVRIHPETGMAVSETLEETTKATAMEKPV